MRRALAATLLLLAVRAPRAAAQFFDFTPARDTALVGDVLTYHAKIHLEQQHSFVNPVPQPLGPLPEGVLVVSADTLRKTGPGTWEGDVRLQFLRPGRQEPQFGVLFRRIGADRGNPLAAAVQAVEVKELLPPGTPAANDVHGIVPAPTWPWWTAAGVALLLLAVPLARRGLRARRVVEDLAPGIREATAPAAYEAALRRLDDIERAGYARRGEVERHYAEVMDVLRDYLYATGRAPRPRPGRRELLAAIGPAPVAAPTAEVAEVAEFVKYAAVRPDAAHAAAFLGAARALLGTWRGANAPEAAGALR